VQTTERYLGCKHRFGNAVNATPEALTFYILPCIYVEEIGMVNPAQRDLPQGTLDLLILRVVAPLAPIHGYAIAQRQMSQEALQVQQGSPYPALHRLEYKKVIAADWRPSETGDEAKFYRPTARGKGTSLNQRPRAGLGLPR
jgi:PadR family transcriptional regulator, regulatory protein PadR